MTQIELDLDQILRYLSGHAYSKNQAVEMIIPILLKEKKIPNSFKWDRDYQREFARFHQRIDQHIDLMLEFRRNRDETIKYLLETVSRAEEEIKDMQRSLESLNKIREASSGKS